eukprot:NODE_4067_length_1236_cov_9.752022_g3574_i0.p1 GENE.NODE_4067_length_1236_cov_9.752022_g3574_i0~~NODE_4067_length_1236_cov_9.752022_g3574_i0.p1  ORF type:complete len:344 (-),score=79.87 NODE_4067_length_1236_cov_9.752022_g3574_i0:169-1200(-)
MVAVDKSLREIYGKECETAKCKQNSYLLKILPSTPTTSHCLIELDLNLNFVGRNGLKPVLEVARRAYCLKKLCLADNFLNNDSVKEIVASLQSHTSLAYMDLSRNPISHAAGKMLARYASENKAIQSILLVDTLINPALIRIIQQTAGANAGITETTRETPTSTTNMLSEAVTPTPTPSIGPTLPSSPVPPSEAPTPIPDFPVPPAPIANSQTTKPSTYPNLEPGHLLNMVFSIASEKPSTYSGIPLLWQVAKEEMPDVITTNLPLQLTSSSFHNGFQKLNWLFETANSLGLESNALYNLKNVVDNLNKSVGNTGDGQLSSRLDKVAIILKNAEITSQDTHSN